MSGRRGYGPRIDGLADFVAGLMANRLAALGAGRGSAERRPKRIPAELRDRRRLEALLRRAGKHLEHKAMAEALGGGASAR